MKCGKNISRGISHFALVSAISASSMIIVPQFAEPASAKNLFEVLFEKHQQKKRERAAKRRAAKEAQRAKLNAAKPVVIAPVVKAKPKAVPIKKVSAPKYYTYKPVSFAPLDFKPLVSSLAALKVSEGLKIDHSSLSNPVANPVHDNEVIHTAAIDGETVVDGQVPVEAGPVGTGNDTNNAPTQNEGVGSNKKKQLSTLSQMFVAGAEHIQDLEVMAEKGMGKTIVAHYKKSPEFMWIGEDGRPNDKAKALLSAFKDAPSIGLYSEDYFVDYEQLAKELGVQMGVQLKESQGEEADVNAVSVNINEENTVEKADSSLSQVVTATATETLSLKKGVNHELAQLATQLAARGLSGEERVVAVTETVEPKEQSVATAQASAKTSDQPVETVSKTGIDIGAEALDVAMTFELNMTARALRFMADSQNGIINPNRLSGYHDFPGLKPDYSKLLAKLVNSSDVVATMNDMQPKGPAFEALKKELAQLDGSNDDFHVEFEPKTLIKPGASTDQLPKVIAAIKHYGSDALKEKHAETLAAYSGQSEYDKPIVGLVKAFQKESGLGADGVIGSNTVAKLVGHTSTAKVNQVRMAMERLRWQPSDLGPRFVFINQPAYTAKYMVGYKTKLGMRAIVGKKSNQTYFFNDTIETVVFNPYWGVPRSIIVNEMLPKLRANPSYLDNAGYEVSNVRGQKVSSSSINWHAIGSNVPYDVRQKPGPKNALGELKILFPNKHAIYMHDTPSRGLFKRTKRALSHGCVRLQKPRDMAAAVLGKDVDYVSGKLASGHGREVVPGKIPVYVSYFTAWPNDDGKVEYFGDMYGRDGALKKAIAVTRQVRDKALGVAAS